MTLIKGCYNWRDNNLPLELAGAFKSKLECIKIIEIVLMEFNKEGYKVLVSAQLFIYLFIWGLTSLSTLYRSYHNR